MLRKNPLKQLDLNLLRLFIYIFELKNLTHTAEALHLSQSAISHALGRLRQSLGDELFYREKGELHPTLYAKRLYPTVKQSFENLEQIFQTNHLLSDSKLGELAQQPSEQAGVPLCDLQDGAGLVGFAVGSIDQLHHELLLLAAGAVDVLQGHLDLGHGASIPHG